VGAPNADTGNHVDQGAAYVFVRSGTTWAQQQKLTSSDNNYEFGYSVAISGETVVVGAPLADIGANSDQGSAYVFVHSGGAWSLQQQLTASDGAAGDEFGSSVAVSGDTIMVGAPFDDINIKINQGSAYVFVRGGTSCSLQQKLTANYGAAFDIFGISVGISGDTAVVGACYDGVGASNDQGSAYVFVRSDAAWKQRQLTGSTAAASDRFGSSVAIDANTVLVGALLDDIGLNFDQGSAYVFVRK
jgi:FG-GAP repeat